MILRPYQSADRKECLSIFKSNTPRFFTPEELSDFEQWLDRCDPEYQGLQEGNTNYYYIAEAGGAVTACGGFCYVEQENTVYMAWGMVNRTSHLQGIGHRLFEYRMQQISDLYPGLPVCLDTSQHTYTFFEKLGFRVTGIQKDYYGPGLDRYDMIKDKAEGW
jgi:ribosomal-protein-alanine N-acetyltransferase